MTHLLLFASFVAAPAAFDVLDSLPCGVESSAATLAIRLLGVFATCFFNCPGFILRTPGQGSLPSHALSFLTLSLLHLDCAESAWVSICGHGALSFPTDGLWLCVVMSKCLTTFKPSNLTSIDQELKYTFPFVLLVRSPFFGAQPASSPVLFLKYDLFLSITSLPEILTFLLPEVVSLATPVLGYGIGTPGGVAGVCGGVKQTSGKAQILLPDPALQEISRPLANTSLDTLSHRLIC